MLRAKTIKIALNISLMLAMFLLVTTLVTYAKDSTETISATAYGTSTQLGRNLSIQVIIYDFSTPEDRQQLVQAFQKGQNDGLADALSKVKPVGRINIPGTVGYELGFIRQIDTPNGRVIRFITNRKIAFAESYANSRSESFNLTAGEIQIDDQDQKKSSGVLYPAAQLIINKQGELQFELNQNAWRLSNIIDWKKGKKEKEK